MAQTLHAIHTRFLLVVHFLKQQMGMHATDSIKTDYVWHHIPFPQQSLKEGVLHRF